MAMTKNPREIRLIRRAAAIANSCIPLIEKSLREDGMTERELALRVRKRIYRTGGRLSFKTLVGCGDRSAMIHTKPSVTDRKISGIGYIDFGASYGGYKVDLTVPFVKGKVGKREMKIVGTVQKAYKKTVRSWRFGMQCWVLHKTADGVIRSNGLSMRHAVGHGVGRRIHESPLIVMPRKKLTGRKLRRWERIKRATFQNGMAFTIEPGAYVDGIGGSRIENTFLVSGRKLKALTKARLLEVP